jgi:hypothetical protein
MADTAAHLVDRVLPEVPFRQWVLSLPFALRYRLAYDSRLVSEVLRIFVQVVFSSLRRRARKHIGIQKGQCGAVTFVQRFGGSLNLNIHLHSLVLDGVYYVDDKQQIRFQRLPPPSDSEVRQITERIARRIIRLLERRGLGPKADSEEADTLSRDQPLLAELYNASVQGRIAVGPQAGNYLLTDGIQADLGKKGSLIGSRCANVLSFSLHANVCIPAKARRQLENLCRYVARPAVATERLSVLPDGRVLYQLRHKWRNGATQVVFEPLDLIGKLAALVPPPRFNLVRYQGIFSPAARWRLNIVPFHSGGSESTGHTCCNAEKQERNPERKNLEKTGCRHSRNYSWAELMKRVFDQSTNCMPRPRNNYIRPSYAPLSSPVGTGSRLC